MGKPTGFLEIRRELTHRRDAVERLNDYRQVYHDSEDALVKSQGARCMDCGIPFCHTGCPLGNVIPDWNDLVYRDRWREAADRLHLTNNFPEFTGWVCPAPCESSCVLGINDDPVTIKQIELAIVDRAWREGWIVPMRPDTRTSKKVAIVGSGPAGLAAAQQLARAGHDVTVFERADRIGGLLVYGIPDFKLEKSLVDRRLEQLSAEGVEFRTGAHVGADVTVEELRGAYDAVILAGGATRPRDLTVPGRELDGIHFAMEFLPQQNKRNAGGEVAATENGAGGWRHYRAPISAAGKRVVILGGGDTGSDCLGTSLRQGALSVHQFELMPKPPADRTAAMPWPQWPMILRTSSSHEEGLETGRLERDWSIATKSVSGAGGKVEKLHGVRLDWTEPAGGGRPAMSERPDSEFTMDADLVLLAMGFVGPEDTAAGQFGCKFDERGNVSADGDHMTSVPGVFAAGDLRRGQSLVVWAINEGRQAAKGVDKYLMGSTSLG